MAKRELTVDRVRALLHYDPETGVFTNRVARSPRAPVGAVSGNENVHGKRWVICIDGHRDVMAHRLAWLYMTGRWPEREVDHIDGNGLNNRWKNLRQVSREENMQNLRRAHRDSQTGLLGVTLHDDGVRYRARIRENGRTRHLGLYATPHEAHAAYVRAKRAYHPGCTI